MTTKEIKSLEHDLKKTYKSELIKAIQNFNNNPAALENFSNYLETHFYTWLDKFAADPINFICELKMFSEIC